jgi:hypothetical protein
MRSICSRDENFGLDRARVSSFSSAWCTLLRMNVSVFLVGNNQGEIQIPYAASAPLPSRDDEVGFPNSQTVYTITKRQFDYSDTNNLVVFLYVDAAL